LLPTLLGILVFSTPISWNGYQTIGVSIVTDPIENLSDAHSLHIVVSVLVTASVLTILGTIFGTRWILRHHALKDLFDVPRS